MTKETKTPLGREVTICYRAEFEGPTGVLNPSGWKVPGRIGVEVRKSAGHWHAFRPDTKYEFTQIAEQLEPKTIQDQIRLLFDQQVSDWTIYELEPSGKTVEVKPEKVYTDQKGRIYRR